MVEREFRYEWNWTYRIDHWVRVLSIAVLIVTGFYIHWPFAQGKAGGFLMSWMRFSHFVSAYIFILGLIVRIYLAFNSRFDSDWRDFGIIRNIRNIPDILGYYLFLRGTHKEYRRYNPLQALTYLFWVLLIIFMAFTGFSLYQGRVFGVVRAPGSFLWVLNLFGGESYTRIWHFMGMWVFLITVAVHVYMAALASWVRKDHTFRSMFSGYKLKARAGHSSGIK